MLVRTALIAIAAIALAGCNTTSWEKPGVSAQQKNTDLAQCEYEAELASPVTAGNTMVAIDAGLRKSKLRGMCLQARGYQQQAVAQ